MSVDGFIATCEARLEVLKNQMRDTIKKDGGRKIYRHVRAQMMEIEKLNNAIYKAQRRGVRE